MEQRGGANPDGGIDLVLEKGGERIAVQCKQWKNWKLGVKPVREFLGAMTDARISQGIVVTLSNSTSEARELADKHGIELLTEGGLTRMLLVSGVWQDEQVLAILEDITKHCPKCGRPMVLRTASKGPNPGSRFWGCSTYPQCRQTMPVAGGDVLEIGGL